MTLGTGVRVDPYTGVHTLYTFREFETYQYLYLPPLLCRGSWITPQKEVWCRWRGQRRVVTGDGYVYNSSTRRR